MHRRTQRFVVSSVAGLFLAVSPVGLLASTPALASAPRAERIALVDVQRVLNETQAGKAARKRLEASSKAKQTRFDENRDALEQQAARLGSLSGQELIAAQERLQRGSIELQNMLMALEQELGEQHNKLLEAMYRNSQSIVARLADELGLDMVLVRDPMTVIYASAGLDITEVVVAEYDRAYPE